MVKINKFNKIQCIHIRTIISLKINFKIIEKFYNIIEKDYFKQLYILFSISYFMENLIYFSFVFNYNLT